MFVLLNRLAKSLLWPKFRLNQIFTSFVLDQIESFVKDAETKSNAEIYFVIESSLSINDIILGRSLSDRAKEIFCLERVWDTKFNNGILIYINYAESDIEIIYDRGITTTSIQMNNLVEQFTKAIKLDVIEAFSNLLNELIEIIEVKEKCFDSFDNQLSNRPRI